MAYGKRKKGGQRLMEIARAGAKRRAAKKTADKAKAKLASIRKQLGVDKSSPSRNRTKVQITMKPKNKTLEAAKRNIAKGPVTRTVKKTATTKPAKKPVAKKPAKTDAQKLADYRKNPTKGMAPRNLRTPAQRAALRKRLMNLKSEAKGMSDLGAGLTKDLADAEFATKLAIEVGAAPIGGGLASGAAKKVAKTALGKKVKEQVAKRGLTKEGRKLRKAGNFRDTKGRIQKIDPNPFKKGGTKKKSKTKTAPKGKNPFREGGTKKPAKTSAKKSGKKPFAAKNPFNPKGEPAKKGAKKSKAIEIDIPAPKTERLTREAREWFIPAPKAKTLGKKKATKKAPAKKAVKKPTNKRTTNKPIGSKKGTKGRTNKKTTNKPVGSGKGTKGRKPKNKQEQFKQRRLGGFR